MSINKNNKGTSLLELVIAMMIVAIVLLMIMIFMNSASNSFKVTNEDVNLQLETQTIINQLSNLAMEAMDMETHTDLAGDKRFIFQYAADDFYAIIVHEKELFQIQASSLDNAKEVNYNKEEHFLAEYVKKLDITKTTKNNAVIIDLTVSIGKENENIIKTVKFRNYK